MKLEVTAKQKEFMDATATEVLFGGAAGGGKSYAQLVDALWYAMKYPKSKQLVLRRSYPELEKSLIRGALEMYPAGVYKYNAGRHTGRFANGSVLDFGHCEGESAVYRYQSAEYDVIRFDELTHFTETMYVYLMSRLRGTSGYPKQVKSCTNPGGVGHAWVKARFIDPMPPGEELRTPRGSRVFLPARIEDNPFLMRSDPDYGKRLQNLGEREQKALLYGDWDIFEGQFFPEFARRVHVVRPFAPPGHWKVYRTLDYGLDMLACYWVALDEGGHGYVYKEVYEKDLIVSQAAKRIQEADGADTPVATLAPPDLWSRRQETGKSAADIFAENGLVLTRTGNERVAGWLAVKEWLRPYEDEQGVKVAKLRIFENCRNLVRTLPALQMDAHNVNDVALQPHELTHGPDALRGFCVWWTTASAAPAAPKRRWTRDMEEDWERAREADRRLMERMWGRP